MDGLRDDNRAIGALQHSCSTSKDNSKIDICFAQGSQCLFSKMQNQN